MFLKLETSELSWFHGWIDSRDSEGEVGIEIIGGGLEKKKNKNRKNSKIQTGSLKTHTFFNF